MMVPTARFLGLAFSSSSSASKVTFSSNSGMPKSRLRGNLLALGFAAPLFYLDAEFGELRLDLVRVGFLAVALVDGDDEGNFCRLRVADGLFGLRHDRVVRGHDDDGEVGDLRTAGTHGRKGLVTGVSMKVIRAPSSSSTL